MFPKETCDVFAISQFSNRHYSILTLTFSEPKCKNNSVFLDNMHYQQVMAKSLQPLIANSFKQSCDGLTTKFCYHCGFRIHYQFLQRNHLFS